MKRFAFALVLISLALSACAFSPYARYTQSSDSVIVAPYTPPEVNYYDAPSPDDWR